jgi:MtN3 and saliva related transmembrane protein
MYAIFLETIGIIASITSVVCFLPQIYKNHKTKSVEDLSGLMLINFVICSLAWAIYGSLTDAYYVTLTNVIGLIASCFLMGQKIYFKK